MPEINELLEFLTNKLNINYAFIESDSNEIITELNSSDESDELESYLNENYESYELIIMPDIRFNKIFNTNIRGIIIKFRDEISSESFKI